MKWQIQSIQKMKKISDTLDELKGKVPIQYHLLHKRNLSANQHYRVRVSGFYKPIGRIAPLRSYYTKSES
jgi:uncharacterized beta-barrel protein YwiB (DUF1934 family)